MNKKILITVLILITLINTIMPVLNAATIITKANLIYDRKIDTHIQYYNTQMEEWRDIQCGYICYKLDNEKYPAYCISHGLNGVDEEGSYTVSIDKLLDNKLIYNTIINGYPYKTPAQLGVESVDDAYVATKQALNTVMLNRDVKTFYKAVDAKGEKIIDAIYKISEAGKVGNVTNKEASLSINKVGTLIEQGEYYYQEYSVSADVNISEYTIKNLEGLSSGWYITDINGNKTTKFNTNQHFRVMIPKEDLNKDILGQINIIANCNSKPIFYGEAPNGNIQDYAITYKPYVEYSKSVNLSESTNTASIKVIKQDEQTLSPIADVLFGLYNEIGNLISSQKTNSDGIAIFNNLYQGKYILKELEANEKYINNENIYEIETEYNKQFIQTITNIHKKGKLKLIKVDKDNPDITLGAIEFDLIDENGNTVAHLITDVNGESQIDNINIGRYTLKETETKREYNLCENTDIIVEWNKTTEKVIENEKQKGQIKVIKEDLEDSNMKLSGVKFQILNKRDEVVEEIVTDINGEAISSKLLVGEYKIKEVDLGSNTNYILNDELYIKQVENNNISEIVVKNSHKKGDLKIKKVDKDNRNVALEGAKFEITDKDGNNYEVVTNEEGIAEIHNIRIGDIKIKEIKTKEGYVLNKEIFNTEIKYNECVEVLVENEKKKGQIEIYKTDKEDKNIKIPNVEFEILNINNKVVDKLITNENGYAISKKLPIGEYYLKETKTNRKYILNEEVKKINIEYNKIFKLNIENKKKQGRIQIIKTSSNNSPILDIKQGDFLEGVEFQIFNFNNELVDTLITDKFGQAISKKLEIGRYKVIEKNTNKYYILNKNEFFVGIENNNEIKVLKIKNEAKVPKLDIEKIGEQFAEKNEEIRYEFDIINISNTKLDNFTWIDYIPYEDCKLTKMTTGIYNENLDYEIYYKTNKNDYKLLKVVNSLTSEYINFDDIKLEDKEIVVEIKVEYKTVSKDFNAITKPCIFVKIDNDVKKDDKIVNTTELYGNIEDYIVKDISSFNTIITKKEILKKLPKTGC